MKTIEKISTLINEGHEQEFLGLANKIEEKREIHPDLKLKLEALGNNPIEEPEIYKAGNEEMVNVAKLLLTDDEIVSYSGVEVGDFIYAAVEKVSSVKTEDGVFKNTPNTEDIELPNFIEADELVKLGKLEHEISEKLNDTTSAKKQEKMVNKLIETSDKLKEKALEISKLNIEILTEWEKVLVVTQIYSSAVDASTSSMGKHY